MSLKIYNTASRTKEEFKPINPDQVTMYTCGITLRGAPHIGNLRTFTSSDIIYRGLKFLGYKVRFVSNFTDVGHMTMTDAEKLKLQGTQDTFETEKGIDRVQKTAEKQGKTIEEVVNHYKEIALEQYHKMNFLEPEKRPLATQYIKEQQELILKLIKNGCAYITDSAIYFDTSKDKDYGKLSGQKMEEKVTGVRSEVIIDKNKKNPADFRLWQSDQPEHAQQWDFVIDGKNYRGFPGWHIECSAMAMSILGETIDIHTGGRDLITPHHENEIAQSECATGHDFVHYWNHTEFLLVDNRKMSNSLGNFYTLKDIEEKGFSPMDLRYFYLTANFNVQQNFTLEALRAAQSARKSLVSKIQSIIIAIDTVDSLENGLEKKFEEDFRYSIEDNFNMPQALAVVWDIVNSKDLEDGGKIQLIKKFDNVLGLNLFEEKEEISEEIKAQLEELISKRNDAKTARDFEAADALREEARALGYELEDGPQGTRYKKI